MGNWFSNLHISKNDSVSLESITDYLSKKMLSDGYSVVPSQEEADLSYAILTSDDSKWFSVYSDGFSFDDPGSFSAFATPLSEAFSADVLGISCFDSDYLFLNLINASDKTDAWLSIGSASGLGIKRRTNLSAWKKKVADHSKLKETSKAKYTFAEDSLADLERQLSLPLDHSGISYEELEDICMNTEITYLYFKLPESAAINEPPVFDLRSYSFYMQINHPVVISVLNTGGVSKGFSVYFFGPFVENDELVFYDVSVIEDKGPSKNTKFELQKAQFNGQWAYYFHYPNFRIPPKVDDRLSEIKQARQELERQISVRFIPRGKPINLYDLKIAIVPDKNPAGMSVYSLSYFYKSKKSFIDSYNQKAKEVNHLIAEHPDSLISDYGIIPLIVEEE